MTKMKQELKRIEAALHQLANRHSQGYLGSVPQRSTLAQVIGSVVSDRAGTHSTRIDGDKLAHPPSLEGSVKAGVPVKISLPSFAVTETVRLPEPVASSSPTGAPRSIRTLRGRQPWRRQNSRPAQAKISNLYNSPQCGQSCFDNKPIKRNRNGCCGLAG
ncbi:hypothetical protein K9N68_11360 [Kovacikia minuta CCNUW1]|uniref:hypothetical protein n=1 Tax=Kovacikia minuta TaxID=2931930 RepID=UPI001CCD5BDE|nr:hypothetical protein [Kovacikia minuta]UBF28410.1 hypothetical protein K9N68_11360 [Kovacikia minuta CCNUW1]